MITTWHCSRPYVLRGPAVEGACWGGTAVDGTCWGTRWGRGLVWGVRRWFGGISPCETRIADVFSTLCGWWRKKTDGHHQGHHQRHRHGLPLTSPTDRKSLLIFIIPGSYFAWVIYIAVGSVDLFFLGICYAYVAKHFNAMQLHLSIGIWGDYISVMRGSVNVIQ